MFHVTAQNLYVNSATGNNRNDGTKESPFKNLQKAVEKATEGATIYVAEGNYFGTLDKGNIIVTKPIKIYGGYSSDFATRDVLKYCTLVQPSPESNGTAGPEQGTFVIKVDKVDTEVVVDGLIFDRGNSISYSAKGEGKPEGVECPMMNPIGAAGIGGADLTKTNVLTKQTSTFYITATKADITIRNCVFLNSPYYGIIGSSMSKKMTIENCVFIGNRFAAIEYAGAAGAYNTQVYFKNNTVLFNWSRLKDYLDLGYGFRFMPQTDAHVENNIFGLSIFSGLDRGRSDSNKTKDAARICTSVNNVFFLNKLGDLAIPGGGNFMFVKAEDFDDVEQLTTVKGNQTLTDPAVFKGVINEPYLNGFLAASYKETTNVDPNSPANQFRQAMGMNTQGTMQSSASMFANRYPWRDALKFFGAMQGYGAQTIKN
jgi:hypothetical protein